MNDLPKGSDPRLIAQIDGARKKIADGIQALPPAPTPLASKEELDKFRASPKYLGNVRPPLVVDKISSQYPDASNWLSGLTVPFLATEDIKARIQELALALLLVGFARDKSIAKEDPKKSEDGARAQFSDISHICAAATCDMFVTSDRRCARLAFAIYEALKLKTVVLHLTPGDDGAFQVKVVGINHWP